MSKQYDEVLQEVIKLAKRMRDADHKLDRMRDLLADNLACDASFKKLMEAVDEHDALREQVREQIKDAVRNFKRGS